MQQLRTVKILIGDKLSDTQKQSIVDTAMVFNDCTRLFVNKMCENHRCAGIYRDYYRELKESNPRALADMITTSVKKASLMLRSHNTKVKPYNKRLRSKNKWRVEHGLKPLEPKERWVFNPKLRVAGYCLTSHMFSDIKGTFSVSTIDGRLKFKQNVPAWFDKMYPNRRFYSGWLSCKEVPNNDREYALMLTYVIDEDSPVEMREITPETTIGVDRGIYNIVALSNGTIISSKPYYAIERKYARNVETLKQKHSSSARKRLRSMSGKKKRYAHDKNHVVSKLVCSIPNVSCLVFEDLTNIRDERSDKKHNRWKSNWSFKDLENKIKYKAESLGITVQFINPYNTSRRCSECGYVDAKSRKSGWFRCTKCGHLEHADLNASKNIRDIYLEAIGSILASTPNSQGVSQGFVSNP